MPKIDLRKAVQSVKDYIVDFNDILENDLDGVMVEETELSEDEKYWLITIGFNRKIDPREQNIAALSIASGILAKEGKAATIKRDYKIFQVDSSTGEVVSMKIYKL